MGGREENCPKALPGHLSVGRKDKKTRRDVALTNSTMENTEINTLAVGDYQTSKYVLVTLHC